MRELKECFLSMPNRYLRQSYIESESVNSLSWQSEVVWTRLIVVVDDWGRCEANVKLLRPKLFPLRLDQVREADLQRSIAECEKAGLVRLYASGNKEYLQMMKWEKGRAEKSKWPEPPEEIANSCMQLHTAVNNRIQPKTFPPTPIPIPTPVPDSDTDAKVQTNNSEVRFPSLAEIQTEADMRGFDKAEAERFWNHFESSGWIDKNGNPIKNWRAKLAIWCSDAKARSAERAHHGPQKQSPADGAPTPTQVVLHSKELERVESRITTIRSTYSGMQTWSNEDKAEIKRLKARRDELKKMLGVSV